jgi:hypothetical protein
VSSPDLIARVTANLEGYANTGPSYWPGAHYFTLVSLQENGDTDGGGADVCRDCVIKVACDALYVVERGSFGYEQVTRFNVQDGMRSTAVEVCGPAPLYEVEGSSDEPEWEAWCADCGRRLAEV